MAATRPLLLTAPSTRPGASGRLRTLAVLDGTTVFSNFKFLQLTHFDTNDTVDTNCYNCYSQEQLALKHALTPLEYIAN